MKGRYFLIYSALRRICYRDKYAHLLRPLSPGTAAIIEIAKNIFLKSTLFTVQKNS